MPQAANFFERYSALALFLDGTALNINDIAFLESVRQSPGAKQADVCVRAALSRSEASRIMIKLLDLNLITERLAPTDMRASHVRITSRGENVLFETAHAIREKDLTSFMHQLAAFDATRAACKRGRAEAVVLCLVATQDEIGLRTLQKAAGCKPSALSSIVSRLRAQGLAKTHQAPSDRRRMLVFSTPTGQKAAAPLLDSLAANDAQPQPEQTRANEDRK